MSELPQTHDPASCVLCGTEWEELDTETICDHFENEHDYFRD